MQNERRILLNCSLSVQKVLCSIYILDNILVGLNFGQLEGFQALWGVYSGDICGQKVS